MSSDINLEKLESGFEAAIAGYDSAVDKHQKLSKGWFNGLVITLVLSFAILVIFILFPQWFVPCDISNETTYLSLLAIFMAKASILGFIAGVSVWCARHLRIQKHLQTVNERRSRSIKTIEALLNSTNNSDKDGRIRHLIIEKSLGLILQPIPTGYLVKDETPSLKYFSQPLDKERAG